MGLLEQVKVGLCLCLSTGFGRSGALAVWVVDGRLETMALVGVEAAERARHAVGVVSGWGGRSLGKRSECVENSSPLTTFAQRDSATDSSLETACRTTWPSLCECAHVHRVEDRLLALALVRSGFSKSRSWPHTTPTSTSTSSRPFLYSQA